MIDYSPHILERELDHIITDCTECGNCVKQCGYLQHYGTPAAIAKQFRNGTLDVEAIYSCSLCRLCDVFCPEKLEPSYLFWLMRCRMVAQGRAPLKQHHRILAYERRGLSDLFELYAIPDNARTVFFPGCALAGSRPAQLLKLLALLQDDIPDVGIVLSCCSKPSHDLGRTDFFEVWFGKLLDRLGQRGVDSIITACPSCHQMFSRYGSGLSVRTIYELMADRSDLPAAAVGQTASMHDPCATRFDAAVHRSARKLAASIGVQITEMKHRGKRTLCCGEGGSACFVAPHITDLWKEKRCEEAAGMPVLTYCAGCEQFFSKRFQTIHIIDLVLEPDLALAGASRIGRTPFTYVNRLRLKRQFKKVMRV